MYEPYLHTFLRLFSYACQPESERQVVCAVTATEICRLLGSRIHGREPRLRNRLGSRLHTRSRHPLHLPGTDGIEPTALPFTGVNVERNVQFFPYLDIELLDLVSAEYVETHLERILVVGLDYVFLHLPLIPISRNTASRFEHGYHFTL